MPKSMKYRDLTHVIMLTICTVAIMGLINLHAAHPAIFQAFLHTIGGFTLGSLAIFRFYSWLVMCNNRGKSRQYMLDRATFYYLVFGISLTCLVAALLPFGTTVTLIIGYYLGTFFGREVMKGQLENLSQNRQQTPVG